MVKIIAFANQKGGVGKTTTAINIGTSLATIGRRVLLVDLDAQGNAGTGLGFVRSAHPQSVYNVLMGTDTAANNILSTSIPNMHIMPASAALSGAEVELLDMDNREYRLRDALKPVYDYYDYILFDCPPALGFLTLNALTTADSLIIPLQCEFFALEGLQALMGAVNEIQKKWNPSLSVLGIVLTMYDKRYAITRAVEDDVRKTFAELVFQTIIPRNVRVSEAPSHGKPALFYDFNSTGAQAYLRLATEIVNACDDDKGVKNV
ncbi:MAG: AAA family ATPase [Rickettsiales bacterium]|nr:AAA family ATPase [Rickettsiales bacterium]